MGDESTSLVRFIAASGLVARREAVRLVADGKVKVNGVTARDTSQEVRPGHDRVQVDGKTIRSLPPRVYYVMNKPRGLVTTRDDPEGRPDVYSLLPKSPFRVASVGRLDFNTEGALLFTNDGDLAHKLTHPSYEIPRRYIAKVYRTPSEATLDKIRRGIRLEDGRTVPCKARLLERTDKGNSWVEITVTEGRNRLVRRLFEALGHPVSKLRRASFASISVKDMPLGTVRPLTSNELDRLKRMVGDEGDPSRSRKGWAAPKKKSERHGKRRPKAVDARRRGKSGGQKNRRP